MATSFASLCTDVSSLTNRPDLVNETALAVKAATLKAHQYDDWIKDFHEDSVAFSVSDYYQTLDYKALFPNWRKPRYARALNSTGLTPTDFLDYVVPEKVVDEYGSSRTNIFYIAGSLLQIRTYSPMQYCTFGHYDNPTVTSLGFSSWIADDHPFAIIYEAARSIFKQIGFDEQEVAYRKMVEEQMGMLVQHATTGTGM